MVNAFTSTGSCGTSNHGSGLSLAPTAVNMAMYENSGDMKGYNLSYLVVALITLLVTIIVQVGSSKVSYHLYRYLLVSLLVILFQSLWD